MNSCLRQIQTWRVTVSVVIITLLVGAVPDGCVPAPASSGKHVVFVIGEREYQTKDTLPLFAKQELAPRGIRYTVVHADPEARNEFPGIEVVQEADLLILSVRRRTLRTEPFGLIRRYVASGKPVMALRTSSHAFALRNEDPPPGHEAWPGFDVEVLGGLYEGHYDNDLVPTVSLTAQAADHPITAGVRTSTFPSGGSLYRSRALAPTTRVLLEGRITEDGQEKTEPVAWTNTRGQQRVFYTSLGHPDDFAQPPFRRILTNAVYWALGEDPP